MSLEAFARTWATSPASGNALLVHLALADLARGKLVQIPQADIADLARCSVTTVARALQELIELGAIVVMDDKTKPPIYALIHQTDGISKQLRMNDVDNLQIDGILQDDSIEPGQSGQSGGVQAVRETEHTTGGLSPHGTVPDSEPFRALPSNIGQPIPISTDDVADVHLVGDTATAADLEKALRARVFPTLAELAHAELGWTSPLSPEPDGARVIVTPEAPPLTFRALAASAIKPPVSDPVAELSAFLRELGVQPNPEAPVYWYRDEHVTDFESLLRLAGKSGPILINEVRAAGIKLPHIRQIKDTHDALAKAKIIPF